MTDEVIKAVDALAGTFEEFKKVNDERLSQIEKAGHADPLVEEKLKNIEADLDRFEDFNQKFMSQKAEQDKIAERVDGFEALLKRPDAGVESKQIDHEVKLFDKFLRKGKEGMEVEEVKALTVSDDSSAGFLAPSEYVRELIKTITEISPMRQIARVRQTSQKAIEMPSRTATFTAQWVAESGARAETTGYTTQLETIPAHEVYALVDISQQELEDSVFDLEAEMQSEFATQFAKAEGEATVTGDAIGKPEGFTVNSDVSTITSKTNDVIDTDDILDLAHNIKTEYGTNGIYVFNRSTLGAIRKLQDTAGQYIFQAGMMGTSGVPNTIAGRPYVEMPDMANVANQSRSIAFGDFARGYMIVDRVSLSVLRDPFTQATSGNVRYVARRRVGGQVVLPEAITILVTQ